MFGRFNHHLQRGETKHTSRRLLSVESLENRFLLSNSPLPEVEPNGVDSPQLLPLGFDANEQSEMVVSGQVGTPADPDDWFQLELAAGDVLGVLVQGQNQLDPTVSLHAPGGTLLMFNDNHSTAAHNYNSPNESPLSGLNSSNSEDSFVRYVINAPGSYAVQVAPASSNSEGNYRMDLIVARPGMESEPLGATQILFVDFDGATVNMSDGKVFGAFGGTGKSVLSPMRDFLPYWGFTAADENALIDVVLSTLDENFHDAIANGNNPDADLVILNSRDHADEFGINPYVSRVIIGGTRAEADLEQATYPIFAFAQHVDTGNYDFDDSAVVLLDELSGMAPGHFNYDFDLNRFGVHPSSSKIELVGTALGNIASHEVGHNLGSYHSENATATGNIMGRRTPWGFDLPGAGPDKIFGNADDVDKHFRADPFSQTEPFAGVGINDTLNTTAFGLSTGTAQSLHATHSPVVGATQTLTTALAEPLLTQAISYWGQLGAPVEALGRIDLRVADLPDTQIGRAYQSTITMDSNAAGWGWVIDAHATGGRMDLLSALTHEIGHLLDYEHGDGGYDVMAASLPPGWRLLQISQPEHLSPHRIPQFMGPIASATGSEALFATDFSLQNASIDARRVIVGFQQESSVSLRDTVSARASEDWRASSADRAIAMMYREPPSDGSDDVLRDDDLLDLVSADVVNR